MAAFIGKKVHQKFIGGNTSTNGGAYGQPQRRPGNRIR